MEKRKLDEIEHYNNKFDNPRSKNFEPAVLNSFQFLYKIAAPLIKNKKVLDYGCGNGTHTGFLAKHAAEVTAIDLSEKSLEIARKSFNTPSVWRVEFLKMDAEKMDFSGETFDVVFDGGTFSSLDLAKALPEIKRVLKPNGILVGIETFGHNPITNFKRKLNVVRGKRTKWSATHILKKDEIGLLRHYFKNVEVYYFHIISWVAFPFINLPCGKALLKLLETIDAILSKIPFIKGWAFKIVFTATRT